LHDRLPRTSYALLRLGGTRTDTTPLEQAFRYFRAPLVVVDVPDEHVRDLYGYHLILVRPDLHVAWRGHRLPRDPFGEGVYRLAARVTGHEDGLS
jgi:hypothetical protein